MLVEALAFRLPVLAADCPAGPRIILDGGRLDRPVPGGEACAFAGLWSS